MPIVLAALDLARRGFYVFPLGCGAKKPESAGWQQSATRDPAYIRNMWTCPYVGPREYNIGVYTGKFAGGKALLVVDVDEKNGKHGLAAWRALLDSHGIVPTAIAVTPTGGRHVFFTVDQPIKQGVDVLGDGLDTRSAGGYVVGVGSVLAGIGEYKWEVAPPYID